MRDLPTIFVSHSSRDLNWCKCFVEEIKRLQFDIWIDESGINVGSEWVKSIQYEIENRDIFLIILSPNAWESEWVQREFQLAFSLHKHIVGVIYLPVQVHGWITLYQLINVIGNDCYSAAQIVVPHLKIILETNNKKSIYPVMEHSEIKLGEIGSKYFFYAISIEGDYQIACSSKLFAREPSQYNKMHKDAYIELITKLTNDGWRSFASYQPLRWYGERFERNIRNNRYIPNFQYCEIDIVNTKGRTYFIATDISDGKQIASSQQRLVGDSEPSPSYIVNQNVLNDIISYLLEDSWEYVGNYQSMKWYNLRFQRRIS